MKHQSDKPMITLMDTGGQMTFIHRKALPPGCVPMQCAPINAVTTAGLYQTQHRVYLGNLTLPAFSNALKIRTMWAYVFDAPC